MAYFENDDGAASKSKDAERASGFMPLFPTETRGDGRLKANNVPDDSKQGQVSSKRKASCANCGFLLDLNRDDVSGGSDDGNGAGGTITTTTQSITLPGGVSYTEYSPSQAFSKGSGCPLCFSRNGSQGGKVE